MSEIKEQLSLFSGASVETVAPRVPNTNSSNALEAEDKAFHSWYRFVLSYPPHLVRRYLSEFNIQPGMNVLDPFCGTGTTIVEAKRCGFDAFGFEANLFPQFASSVKVSWTIDPEELVKTASKVAKNAQRELRILGIDELDSQSSTHITRLRTLEPESEKLLITNSISPLPLHKTLVLLDELTKYAGELSYRHMLLALGNALVNKISNLRFGPEVGVGKLKKDAIVVPVWLAEVMRMADDLRSVRGKRFGNAEVFLADARQVSERLEEHSIDLVITSPPYPNEKDYTRTTRLESVLLGFYTTNSELRTVKKSLVRSNTRSVYTTDDDDTWVANNSEIQAIADEIEAKRIELGKTSGFERLYARLTRLYFGGMARHLAELRTTLRPGAYLAYVVGDQASYLRVMIRTGRLLANIAQELGYEVVRIDLFRTRYATATQSDLNEEVVVLRWLG